MALECCRIFAFDGPEAKGFQDQFKNGLTRQLTRCDVCVREYHRSRALLVQSLESQFDSEEVQQFMEKFDAMNIARIGAGLDDVAETLVDLPMGQRNIKAAGDVGLYGLFEALNCIPFLKDEMVLQQFFDRPIHLVQTNKKLKLPSFAPGMGAFIFSQNKERYDWAAGHFTQIKRPLTGTEFEHSIKPFLETAISRVNVVLLDSAFLPNFWRGLKLITSKLTKSLITNHLRAMDSNVYTVALEHFQIDNTHFTDLLRSYQTLLDLSPSDFWEAMGSISAQSVVETIFRSPALQNMLMTTEETKPLQLEEIMEWTVQIVKSIKPANLITAARTVLDQLLHQLQDDKYSRYSRNTSWEKGLVCLLYILKIMKEKVQGGPIVTHMIQVVAQDHITAVLQELDGIEKKEEVQLQKTEQLCLDIVEHALALDIAGLGHDRSTINNTKVLDHELGVSGLNVWKMSMRKIKPGQPHLATSVLSGISGLLTLEKFTPRQVQAAPNHAQGWNDALNRLLAHVCSDLLDRLDSFSPDQLIDLFNEPRAAQGLITLLFNGEPRVHQAAFNVLKVLSGEDSRRDSLMHIVRAFSGSTMSSVAQAVDRLARSNTFAPCSITLRICTDIFSCLCDSQDGVLRSKELTSHDVQALQTYWKRIWELLDMIFDQTEPWSNHGYDKVAMQDFCRETMDFADYAFDQYSILTGALHEASESSKEKVKKMLLEQPKSKFGRIAKWLRLRDDYLIGKAVGLTGKILGRLKDVDIKIGSDAAQFIHRVVTTESKDPVKTKLSMQQKAELQRALERNLGEGLSDVIDVDAIPEPKKQMSLQQWASGGRSSGASTPTAGASAKLRPGTIDLDHWSDAAKTRREIQAVEDDEMQKFYGSLGGAEAYKQKIQQQKKSTVGPATAKAAQKHQDDQKSFLQKRQKEKEEAEKRRVAALAKAKGVSAGSGVSGLGDIGKDHSLKGQNVMVSSDEESGSEEGDELDADLFGLSTKQKRKIERPNVEPNGAIGLKIEQKTGPTKIQRTARSLKDMRARLAPNLAPLHEVILKWDFFHAGDYPPGAKEHHFKEVANSFNDPITYRKTFEPLLTLEAWQGMVKAREENANKPYEIKIQNRTNVDACLELSSAIGHNENREIQLQEGDIMLFSKSKKPAEDATAPHCLARIYRVKRQKAICEVVYQVVPGTSLAPSLISQAVVWGVKVQSITPLEREYGALQALQYYDLCTQIVKARPSNKFHFSEKQIATFQDVWNVNRAQSEAVNAALDNEGFSLIQGPPGSGKTKTIVAIVGGLLTHTLSNPSGGSKISLPKAHGNENTGNDATPKKLLVCAPSNAAVDELVMRLKEGVETKSGRLYQLNIVRVGRSDAINAQVQDVTMDELVAKRLGNNESDQKTRERNAELFKAHEKISAHLRELYQKRDNGDVSGKDLTDLETNIVTSRKRKNELGVRIDNAKDDERNAGRQAELNRKKAQQAVLNEAHVICATLSGSGHDMFQSLSIEFETVIIDEAAQCVEMSSLIPLKYGCVKCIMVGDPKQLPPTVFSKEAAKFQYEQSLFVRMQNNFPDEVHLLDTQYRMHPEISIFPSRTFYDGLLKDGAGMIALRRKPWHASSLLAPYRFFDVAGQHKAAPKGHSLINIAEIEIAMALFDRLTSDFPNYDFTGRIGIVTPYKSQLRALKDRFSGRFGNGVYDIVEFNTTDAFQGRESEIIIFSCVRASPAGGIGFLQDIRRMNVGLTRAKSSLWVLGNSDSLVRGRFWKKLVEDAHSRDSYTTGDVLRMLKQPSSAFPASNTKTTSMLDVSSHVSQMDGSNGGRPTSTNGLRQGAVTENGAPNYVDPPSNAPWEVDRMEGINYRFKDRISKKTAPNSDAGRERSQSRPPADNMDESAEPEDAEMVNVEEVASRNATPSNPVSRAETPLSGEERRPNQANGTVKPRPANVASQALLKKRPAPSPFMPRKQQRPRPP